MSDDALSRARAGDESASRELVDPYCGELQLHCHRILGSLQYAEGQVQETLLAAWRTSTASRSARRCVPGCTGSRPTVV